jgi:hypothetical protein
MSRRFEAGPILVAVGAIVLVVSLFLDWYGSLTAWDAFEVVEVLLAALGATALVIAIGELLPDVEVGDRRWLPAIVLAVAVLVAAEIINPPPAAGGQDPASGAWIAFGAAIVMFLGTVLTFGRVRFAVSVEGRQVRERVPVVDNRQDTTETEAVTPEGDARGS